MDKDALLRNLNGALADIAQSDRNIARQHRVITSLDGDGLSTASARRLLTTYENIRLMHVASRDRLEAALAGLD